MAASSSPIQIFTKDPDAQEDFAIDWTDWLQGDRITSASWTVPAGINSLTTFFSATIAIIWLGGGTAGVSYSLVCRVVTAGGRTDDRTIKINVVES